MRIEVDHDVCEANGVCERLAPEVYELDDEDVLHIKIPDPPPALLERALEAVESCPKQALRAVDD